MPEAEQIEVRPDESEPLRVELIDSVPALEAALPRWIGLLESEVSGYSIHNDPRLILIRLASDPAIQLRILMVQQGNELVAVAPLFCRDSSFVIQLSIWKVPLSRARVLRLFGDAVVYSKLIDPLAFARSIADFLSSRRNDFDYLEVKALDPKSPFWNAALGFRDTFIGSRLRGIVVRDDVNHRVTLAESYEEFIARFSKKTGKNLRQSVRRLRERGAEIEVFLSPHDVPKLMCCMQEVYDDAWQAKALAGFADTSANRLEYIEGIAHRGWLRSYVIRLSGRAIAFDHGYLHESVYYSMEGAYRQDAAKLSPGTVLSLLMIEDLHLRGDVREIDFGPGDLPYKRVIGNIAIPIRTVCFVQKFRWRLAIGSQVLVSRAYSCIRDILVRSGAAERLRKVVKRKTGPALAEKP
jgi:hypothetical protein